VGEITVNHQVPNERLLESVLCCPQCKGELVFSRDSCDCAFCKKAYPIRNGKHYFVPADSADGAKDVSDTLRSVGRRFPRIYSVAVRVLSPVLPTSRLYKQVLKQVEGCVVNIGSGTRSIGDNVVNVDMCDHPNVSVVADIEELPFKDESLDGIFSIAVLEHVKEPRRVISECYRVLQCDGIVFSVVAFVQPFHASPSDYNRYTKPGIEYLHKDFELIESGAFGGPVSGFLWIFQEFVALLLSFGIRPIRDVLAVILMILTWPIKYLDLLFRWLPTSENIASTFFYHGRKSADGDRR
jgi:SAM-dependent methyltransferase